jgi:opacity protein-like surface antigen
MPRLPALIISLGLFLTLTTNAYAEGSGIYTGGFVGATLRPNTVLSSSSLGSQIMDFDVGYTFGGFVGYDFGNNFRLESEISYRENQISTSGGKDPQAGTSSIMLNGYYDLPLTKLFNLYFGGGFGAATAQLETVSLGQAIDTNETLFAYQLETGIGWNIKPNVTFSLGYRFFDASDPEFVLPAGQQVRMDLENHELILKMRYLFNL